MLSEDHRLTDKNIHLDSGWIRTVFNHNTVYLLTSTRTAISVSPITAVGTQFANTEMQ